MLSPATPDRVMELVGRANQELRWAVQAGNNSPKQTENIYWASSILKGLILPTFPGTLNTESAVQFVNGDSPTTAFRLGKNPYDMVSVEPTEDIEPHEAMPLVQWTESYRQNDTLFGTQKLIGVRAMALAVPRGGRLQVDENGVEQWLEEYKRIHSTT